MARFLPTAGMYAMGAGIPVAVGAPLMGGIGVLADQPGMTETGALLGGATGAYLMSQAPSKLADAFGRLNGEMGDAFNENILRRRPDLARYALIGSGLGAAAGLGYNAFTGGDDINIAIPTAALGVLAPVTAQMIRYVRSRGG